MEAAKCDDWNLIVMLCLNVHYVTYSVHTCYETYFSRLHVLSAIAVFLDGEKMLNTNFKWSVRNLLLLQGILSAVPC